MQRLPHGRLDEELGKIEQPRVPPVPVVFWLAVDGAELAGQLHGWASDPNGSGDGWRGLVVAQREFAPGFVMEFCGWIRAEDIRPRT